MEESGILTVEIDRYNWHTAVSYQFYNRELPRNILNHSILIVVGRDLTCREDAQRTASLQMVFCHFEPLQAALYTRFIFKWIYRKEAICKVGYVGEDKICKNL